MIIAVVGAGGKTTRIHELAKLYRAEQKTVFVTTTTHMYAEENTLLNPSAEQIIEQLRQSGYCMAGSVKAEAEAGAESKTEAGAEAELKTEAGTAEAGAESKTSETETGKIPAAGCEPVKITSLAADVFRQAAAFADITLVEADGSRQLPLKLPNENEPVIPEQTEEIQIIAGMSALGHRLAEVTHRPELADAYMKLPASSRLQPDTCTDIKEGSDIRSAIITPVLLQRLVTEAYLKPLRERYPNARVRIQPGQTDSLFERAVAAILSEEKEAAVLRQEWFQSQPVAVICGGGHVGQQTAKLLKFLDFYTIIIDDREEFVSTELFPGADELYCHSFEDISELMPEQENVYYIVLTRGHAADRICVEQILRHPYAYLGMIGSHRKIAKTFELLQGDGFTQEQISTIHSPIGLSIGAQTPQEIAVSIAAEIIQHKNSLGVSSMTEELLNSTMHGILCIIIEKRGSAPRGVGSMMLVVGENTKHLHIIGSIGGGRLEKEVMEHALEITGIEDIWYDLSDSENAALGMICGGQTHILYIPV